MRQFLKAVGLALATCGALASTQAMAAATYDFSYQSTGGSTEIVSGSFEVDDGTIVAISGTDSLFGAISALAATGAYDGNDNAFSSSAPFLNSNGVSFTAGGESLNLYFSGGSEFGLVSDDSNSVGTFTATPSAVPEPANAAFLVAGLGFMGLVARRRKAVRQA